MEYWLLGRSNVPESCDEACSSTAVWAALSTWRRFPCNDVVETLCVKDMAACKSCTPLIAGELVLADAAAGVASIVSDNTIFVFCWNWNTCCRLAFAFGFSLGAMRIESGGVVLLNLEELVDKAVVLRIQHGVGSEVRSWRYPRLVPFFQGGLGVAVHVNEACLERIETGGS